MQQDLAIQVTSLFLLLVVGLSVGYLGKKLGCTWSNMPIPPTFFLLGSFSILLLSGVFLLFLGTGNVLLALALGSGIILSLLHPVVALSFLIANLFMRPWEMMEYNSLMTIMPRLLASITLFSWLIYSLRNNKHRLVWNLQCILFFALLVWLALSGALSGDIGEGLQFFFSSFFPIVVVCILVLNAVSDAFDLRTLRGALILSVTAVIATALTTNFAQHGGGIFDNRLSGPGLWGNPNDLAALIAFVLPFSLIPVFLRSTATKTRLACLMSSSILLAGLWLTQSRGAVLALVICGVAYLFVTSKSKSRVWVSLLFIFCLPILLFSGINRETSDLAGSEASRWNYVIAGLGMVKSYPIFGVGLNKYPEQYELYTPAFDEWGERTAHSSWVLVMAEAGFIGLFLFVGLFFTTLRSAWSIRKISPEFFLSMISYGVMMTFLSHTYLFLPYLLFALVVSAKRIHNADLPNVTKKPFFNLRAVAALPIIITVSLLPIEVKAEGIARPSLPSDKTLASAACVQEVVSLQASKEKSLNFCIQEICNTGKLGN